MDFDGYPMQVLVVIAKGCKPNSPYPHRVWMDLKPPGFRIPELSRARDALAKAGLVDVMWHSGWRVKPSRLGYIAVEQWKIYRRSLRARAPLFGKVVRHVTIIDQRFDRYAA